MTQEKQLNFNLCLQVHNIIWVSGYLFMRMHHAYIDGGHVTREWTFYSRVTCLGGLIALVQGVRGESDTVHGGDKQHFENTSTSAVWNIMHECIIPNNTCRGVLTG